jgi:vitamin B12 transporter
MVVSFEARRTRGRNPVRVSAPSVPVLSASIALCGALATPVHAQSPAQVPPPPDEPVITVTANRVPTAIQRTGSAVTVIRRDAIERASPTSLLDLLRSVPGVFLTEAGGPGGTSDIRLRGANPNQTLVLIDGVRVNDPAAASGEFDASLIAPALIDRIEVLRGPQSALYGSDAIGGVVNIITKRGRGQPTGSVSFEAGRYGTLSLTGSAAGTIGPWSFAFSAIGQRAEGFSRYGYRIGRLSLANNSEGLRGGRLEEDGFGRWGGYGRLGYDAGQGVRAEIALLSTETRLDLDAGSGLAVPTATTFPDTPSKARRRLDQLSGRIEIDMLDGALTHALLLSATRTDRSFEEVSLGRVAGRLRETRRQISDFVGDRMAAEYQATWRLGQFGTLIGGARLERETADTFRTDLVPVLRPEQRTLAAEQTTRALFGLWQLPVGERLLLSFGGRIDHTTDSKAFATWRTTAAYRIAETGTTLRASAGTGAKVATLFQRFSPIGTPDLRPERSIGVDAGIDQSLFDGRLTLSVTAFANRIRNLIVFESTPACLAQTGTRCYLNVDRATTSGVETTARVQVIEEIVAVSGTYTYLHAKDAGTGLTLARRPQHVGRAALHITPNAHLLIEPSVTVVSERFSQSGERQKLASYARFDVLAQLQFNQNWRAHVRVENLTNAKYQDVYNFGIAGRGVYGGLSVSW